MSRLREVVAPMIRQVLLETEGESGARRAACLAAACPYRKDTYEHSQWQKEVRRQCNRLRRLRIQERINAKVEGETIAMEMEEE